ncbi:cobaltochelatase CobT-related protein, partial [Escherichia coli]|uniref:cobaltochelatase CobT-related protein n=1 Tax=Escherichia coli TaxID=562 RepID=UPI003EDF0530
VAKQIETQTDIDLMAIGIMTDAPERFYSNHALVTSVDSLGSSGNCVVYIFSTVSGSASFTDSGMPSQLPLATWDLK